MDTLTLVRCRIIELCAQRGFTVNGLAEHAGLSASTLKNILYGKSKNPGILCARTGNSVKGLCFYANDLDCFPALRVGKRLRGAAGNIGNAGDHVVAMVYHPPVSFHYCAFVIELLEVRA